MDACSACRLLGLPAQFTEHDISTAFRQKALRVHPDKRPAAEALLAKEEFHMLQLAQETLRKHLWMTAQAEEERKRAQQEWQEGLLKRRAAEESRRREEEEARRQAPARARAKAEQAQRRSSRHEYWEQEYEVCAARRQRHLSRKSWLKKRTAARKAWREKLRKHNQREKLRSDKRREAAAKKRAKRAQASKQHAPRAKEEAATKKAGGAAKEGKWTFLARELARRTSLDVANVQKVVATIGSLASKEVAAKGKFLLPGICYVYDKKNPVLCRAFRRDVLS